MLKIWKDIEKDFEIAEEQTAEFSFTSSAMRWFEKFQLEGLKNQEIH